MSKLAYGTDELQFGVLYTPEGSGPYPIVLLIHGGFWRAAYKLELMTGLAKSLVRHGIAVWNIEYRCVGDPGGGWPGTLQDLACAADYLPTLAADYNLDLQRAITVGHSAGGHLAFWLAARTRIPPVSPLAGETSPLTFLGAISLAGVVDLEHAWKLNLGKGAVTELLGGDLNEVPERYTAASPAALLPLGIPQILFHGTEDDRVPLIVSQEYTRKATEAGDSVVLIELPGADHFVLIDPTSTEWAIILEKIQKCLFPG